MEVTMSMIAVYTLGIFTGLVINRRSGSPKIEVEIKRTAPAASKPESIAVHPGVVHLTPEREADFARKKKESQGEFGDS